MQSISTVTKAAVVAVVLVLFGPAVGDAGGATAGAVELTMSNFRYCEGTACTPADAGYLRSETGPVAGTDNPAAIVDVPQGSTVRWVYRDAGNPGACDSFEQCPGHNVVIEDGSAKGKSKGFVKSRSGEAAITTTITQNAGELVRYFCSINEHYQLGMTGILRVVGS